MTLRERIAAFLGRRPHKTRTLLQMEAVECGAAALGSILGYYGRYVALEELRSECGVSRDGVTAKNIILAARKYGLEAKGYKRELAGLKESRLPAILFWNFNHFVVLEGFVGDTVFLNDPASGPKTITWQELDDGFTGVMLEFSPGPGFVKEGGEPPLVPSLLKWVKGSEKAVLYVLLAGLALVVPGLITPFFGKIFVDQILVQRLQSWVAPLLIGMGITAALRAGIGWLRGQVLLRLQTRLSIVSSGRFLWHLLHLPSTFYDQRYAGEIAGRFGLNDSVAQMLSSKVAKTIIDVMMVVFYGAVMFAFDVTLTLVSIGMVTINLLALKLVAATRIDGNRRVLQEAGKFGGAVAGGLRNIETLKATSRESDFFERLGGHQAKVENAQQELQVKTTALMLVPDFMVGVGGALVLALGGLRVMEGQLTMGDLVAFQSLQASFFGPIGSLVSLGSQLQTMVGNMNRLDDVLRHPTDARLVDAPQVDEAHPPRKLVGKIELVDVTFGYSRLAPPLLEDFNLTIEPGTRVALVGPSGCGKSTISKLVTGLQAPWSGQILFDGLPVEDIPREVLASSLALVDQELAFFEGTVHDNLTLWDASIPQPQLVTATKDALIHDVLTSRAGGFDARLLEGGRNFSGGQRQRIEIARALALNPRILVLDEATSALDTSTEFEIDRNLRRRGCTCLIVAHRLSTIRDCEQIVVLEDGKVMQRGTHQELFADEDGLYFELVSEGM